MARNGEWRQFKACSGQDQKLFFSVNEHDINVAKSICATCPVKNPCLEEGLQLPTGQDFGIWGGLDEDERKRYKKRLKKRQQREKTIASGL